MDGAREYHDAWRGLRILVPEGWRVRRSGAGIFLHDEAAPQAIVVQPRPGVAEVDDLAQDLRSWLERADPQAELQAEPGAPDGARFTVRARLPASGESAGLFALQVGQGGGLISGYLAPAGHSAASRLAPQVLATLQPCPVQPRQPWQEPSEQACLALVPEGWQAEATLNRANPAGLPSLSFAARGGEATAAMATAEGKLFVEPGLLSSILGGLTRGMVGQGTFVDAAGYAEAHLLPALRKEVADARLDTVVPRPDVIPPSVAHQAATAGVGPEEVLKGEPSAVDAHFSLQIGGRQVRQVARVLTMRMPPPLAHGQPLWMAITPHAYRAPGEQFAALEPVLEGVCFSFRADQAWRDREQARVSALIKRQLPEAPQREEVTALLAEAESLFSSWGGRPLAIHERPFVAAQTQLEASAAEAMAELYSRPVWAAS